MMLTSLICYNAINEFYTFSRGYIYYDNYVSMFIATIVKSECVIACFKFKLMEGDY